MPQNNKVLAAFDFDGTISTRDTFFPFLLYVCGRRTVYTQLAFSLLELLKPGSGEIVRDRLKAVLVRRLFAGMPQQQIQNTAREYAQQVLGTCLRPKALERIRWHQQQGHRCIMVSASLDIYLQHIAHELGFNDLLCTRLDTTEEKLNGEFVGVNCRCVEKVRRLTGLLGELSEYTVYAYGDSAGDKEMLAIADEKFFRPFE